MLHALFALLLLAYAGIGSAQSVYRCVGTDGKTTLQQTPCSGVTSSNSRNQYDGAARNAADSETAAKVRRCQGVTMKSEEFPACSSTLLCLDKGHVGADLRRCLRESEQQFAKLQSDWREVERKERELAAELSQPNNPRRFIKEGQVFNNLDFMALIDSKYPDALFYPDQTIAIPFNGEFYSVVSEKVNSTDIPARYRITSITRSKTDLSQAKAIKSLSPSRAESVIDCIELGLVLKLVGHNFIERARLTSEARKNGLCND